MSDYDKQRDAAPVVERVECWREGRWIRVALDGEVVWQRLTSDPAFTEVRVIWQSNRSPAYPRSRLTYETCELLGAWRLPRSRYRSQAVTVPIDEHRGDTVTSSSGLVLIGGNGRYVH